MILRSKASCKKTDQVCRHQKISYLLREGHSTVINRLADKADRKVLSSVIGEFKTTSINLVTPDQVCILASGLTNNKSSGLHGIPDEFSKYALTYIHDWMANLKTGVLTYHHVPIAQAVAQIRPFIKSAKISDIQRKLQDNCLVFWCLKFNRICYL